MTLRARDGWTVQHSDRSEAVQLVKAFHYSKSAPNTATACHGLVNPDGVRVGAAIWIPPTKNAAMSVCGVHPWTGVLCLSRLVVAPEVPINGASFLLGRSMKLIDRARWPVLVTYADTALGHTGAIYRATNWQRLGEVPAGDTWVHTSTGEQRGRKRGPRTLTAAEMRAAGFERRPSAPKIKFVQVAS